MTPRLSIRWLCLAILIVPVMDRAAHADAIVLIDAARASTVAEFFVVADAITLDLEFGGTDLAAFADLLPDDVYERLGNPPRPWAQRLEAFFATELFVRVGDGAPVHGEILEIGPRERVARDEITGEPLPSTGDEPETVVFARIRFPLPERAASLTIGGTIATRAGIGFVLYHRGIAVNDFRYLAQTQTVELDWDDPWYSRFENRALRRTYYAPMTAFIYVEPYEVRQEIIVRPKDLEAWVDLGLTGRDTIPVDMQADLKRAVAEFLRTRLPVLIDGVAVESELAQINFLERTLRSSRVIDPPIELALDGAMLGVIFAYRTDALPQRVTMEWDLFNERITSVPVSAVDQAGPLPGVLDPDYATLEWQNFLKHPELPTLIALTPPPSRFMRWSRGLRWPAALLTLVAAGLVVHGRRRGAAGVGSLATLGTTVVITVGCFWWARDAAMSAARAETVVAGLLHNIYRAFDHRDEERAYDVLSRSVDGEQLTETYLETRKGLVLASQGGARARVRDVEVVTMESEPGAAGGFRATPTWRVAGSVGHWGHVHQRRNQYRATLDVRPVDGVWKLVDLQILEEERLPGPGEPTG